MVDFYGKCRQMYHTWILWVCLPSLKLTAKTPENGWLEDKPFLLGKKAYFQVLLLLVLGRATCFFWEDLPR